MSLSRTSTWIAAGLAAATLAGSTAGAFASESNFNRHPREYYLHGHRPHHRGGIGAGPAIAGAALGILGAATAGIAADRSYNGYPAYSYGPGYGGRYGYDYHPDHGYYGPY